MFNGRHFDRSVILLCVRWYLAYNLSPRDLEEMMAERGLERAVTILKDIDVVNGATRMIFQDPDGRRLFISSGG
jgi:hypothetical protein